MPGLLFLNLSTTRSTSETCHRRSNHNSAYEHRNNKLISWLIEPRRRRPPPGLAEVFCRRGTKAAHWKSNRRFSRRHGEASALPLGRWLARNIQLTRFRSSPAVIDSSRNRLGPRRYGRGNGPALPPAVRTLLGFVWWFDRPLPYLPSRLQTASAAALCLI